MFSIIILSLIYSLRFFAKMFFKKSSDAKLQSLEKIFKVFTKANIRLTVPPTESDRVTQRTFLLFENPPDTFIQEDFFNFHYSHIRQSSHGGHVYRPINMALRKLIEGHPRNMSTQLFENRTTGLGEEEF